MLPIQILASEIIPSVCLTVLLQMELDTVRSDLKHYESMAKFGLLGPEDSDSFRMDSKPQPSNDLNIRLRDELQRCLSGEKPVVAPIVKGIPSHGNSTVMQ
jgi:hypothetical protein